MSPKIMVVLLVILIFGGVFAAWKLMYRGNWESASYTVLQQDGPIELCEYPELKLAVTDMQFDRQGSDGSFMRLFNYISGENSVQQKVAMTTPVFMNRHTVGGSRQMGFVLPEKVSSEKVPEPANERVRITERVGGQYAVVRFAGRIRIDVVDRQQTLLLEWIIRNGLEAIGDAEVAGYDAPWTPGILRRNEVLITVRQP